MGAPPVPRSGYGAGFAGGPDDVVKEFVAHAHVQGEASSGHHNRNFVLPLTPDMARLLGQQAGTDVTVRVRRADALPVVIRTWQDEGGILRAVADRLPGVPRRLAEGDGFALHSYVEGVPLSSVCGNGEPVDGLLVKAMAGLFADMTAVPESALPPLPAGWPTDHRDSSGFLRTLVCLADRQIRCPNAHRFGRLFAALGIPEDALLRFADRVPAMNPRPYSLLHADLHRQNVILSFGGTPPLIWVDWELATYGDPLHDLAVHLVRMRYPANQWSEVIDTWAAVMRAVRPGAAYGMEKDLRHYLAFERAQSVYPDVIRAADSLVGTSDQKSLDEATDVVRRALEEAAEPLRLRRIPEDSEIERLLFRWRVSVEHGTASRVIGWQPDMRVPESPRFPPTAVAEALSLERSAPAHWVFQGTTHLNSVVRIPGLRRPVVVRRRAANLRLYERSYLSEHAVLRAIEEAGVRVAAPRVLALGLSYSADGSDARASAESHFAVHTYEGPDDMARKPAHPVGGLRPHEADSLVDQLTQLVMVDFRMLDPAAGRGHDFYGWLSGQLVAMVRDLPKETRTLARHLGLPGADRLDEILARARVTPRECALLHGDLHPWNLVRRDDELMLSVIDWERAHIGDPLHDLVRHMHLTPTRPETRDRMFRRWEMLLPARYTRGWKTDWVVYRWIEITRGAYVDLARMVDGNGEHIPEVRRRVESYAFTRAAAAGALGLPVRRRFANPYLGQALPGFGSGDGVRRGP